MFQPPAPDRYRLGRMNNLRRRRQRNSRGSFGDRNVSHARVRLWLVFLLRHPQHEIVRVGLKHFLIAIWVIQTVHRGTHRRHRHRYLLPFTHGCRCGARQGSVQARHRSHDSRRRSGDSPPKSHARRTLSCEQKWIRPFPCETMMMTLTMACATRRGQQTRRVRPQKLLV